MTKSSFMPRLLFAVLPCLLGAFSGKTARADDVDDIVAEVADIQLEVVSLGESYLKGAAYKGAQYVAERLVDGENFYRMKDYERAAIIFMDIIENYPNHAAYIDSLFLYADSLFLAGDYLGARNWYQKFLEASNRPGAGRFKEQAIARLIEVAIHLNDYEGVENIISLLGQYQTDDARYVKAKYLYFKGELENAKSVFSTIVRDPILSLKASYMTGVILTLQENYKAAIDLFLKAQTMKTGSREEQEIVDLMNLGAGRLYYEQGFVSHASECYQRIAQNSPYFDAALYESAAVLIQAGDTIRAEQTLEVLIVAVPDSKYLPKAKMLRGNLLLRTGRYDEAERVFDELVSEFTPLMDQLDVVIKEQQDTRKFFFELVERSMATLDVSNILPPMVVKWVSEETEVQRALNLAKDLGAAKGYVKEAERLIHLLEAVVDGPSRVNAIPMLRQAMRRSQQNKNRLGQLRSKLSSIAEEKLGDKIGELRALRQQRQSLAKQLKSLPTSSEDFKKREKKAQEIYNRMRKELARNTIRLDRLSAMTIAIERFIDDPEYSKGVPKQTIEGLRAELKRHSYGVVKMQEQLNELRHSIEIARHQVGVGDVNDKKDTALRKKIKALSEKELQLIRSGGGKLGVRLESIFVSIGKIESRIATFEREIEAEADAKVRKIRAQVREERDRMVGYTNALGSLGDEAEEVVGGVAFENFTSVRKRFHDLVLKADVGIIDVAWLRKEEHTSRITELTKGRLNEIRMLDDEFQEVKSQEQESEPSE